ncbi:MAG TPA: M48 family metallopeptidase [Candidatus Limnocylindrales bacterium]|nr:M48 family metallopeptidase [Candidatus Limnocylindrales bacterium]
MANACGDPRESSRSKRCRKLVWLIWLFLLWGGAAGLCGPRLAAQEQAKPETTGTAEASKQNTDRFRLSRDRYQKAVAYSRAGYVLHFVGVAWGIVVLIILLRQKIVAGLRDFAEARSGKRLWQSLIFVPGLILLLGVLDLPLEMYWHRLSLRYEQSVQGWGSWFWDWTKGELISFVFGLIAAWILFAVIRWKPRRWWLYFWFAAIPLVLFVVLIAPWVLDPMFNKFTPLAEKHADLVESIGKLTTRAGMPIPAERMFLMEASAKTNQINAYVTGLGASKRVVVWDNTIKKMAPGEVLFVVGHEMGHYVLGHVVKGIAFGLAVIFIGLYLAYRALQWLLRSWGERWGVRGQDDWAALAVLLLIASVLGFFAEPIGNGFSRTQEHAADVYGLEVTHGIVPDSAEAAAHAFQVMGELDLADPNPSRFITIWLYSHPPLVDRLKFAHDYDPWGKGVSPQYVK